MATSAIPIADRGKRGSRLAQPIMETSLERNQSIMAKGSRGYRRDGGNDDHKLRDGYRPPTSAIIERRRTSGAREGTEGL